MRSLRNQLMLGFALVTLVSALVTAVLANNRADETFRGYLAQSQALDSGIVERLAQFYAAQGSWENAAGLLLPGHPNGMNGMGGLGRGQNGFMGGSLALADAAGRIVANPGRITNNAVLSAAERSAAIPINVDNRTVGYLLAHTPRSAALPIAGERFLANLNTSLWTAGLLAGMLGLALGLLIARNLAAPLGLLADGARRMARGHFNERVPIAGPREVQTVAHAFNEMAATLESAELQRRRMMADIAHELRTPLTVIQGNLRALLDDVYPLSKQEVATVYQASLGLHRLVDDLRELSLAEAGRLNLDLQAVAVAPLLEREAAFFAETAASRGVGLNTAMIPALPAVQADPERVAQMLRNLISNALQHTPAGGTIMLGAELNNPAGQAQIRFTVDDTGNGIAPADVPHVFERFYRADKGRARETGGSGLGLAITAQLARLQGGTIGVSSEPGQGARFWFTLPVEPVSAAHAVTISEQAASKG
ncbi:MAG: HAMP domain-containing histidine kinase [Oscillochloris sp.]|nr:HAMP domain-containing histidine kinase [Oscillochloris sp.]